MDIKEFINKLFLLYPNSWTVDNEFIKKRQYIVALESKKIDFQKLLDRIAKNYDKDFMPTTAWLIEQACYCYPISGPKRYLNVKIYNPVYKCEMVDCIETTTPMSNDEIIKVYLKIFPNHKDGWEVKETYWQEA